MRKCCPGNGYGYTIVNAEKQMVAVCNYCGTCHPEFTEDKMDKRIFRSDMTIGKLDLIVMGRPNGVCAKCDQRETTVNILYGPSSTSLIGEISWKDAHKLGQALIDASQVRG